MIAGKIEIEMVALVGSNGEAFLALMLYLPTRHSLNGSEIETSDPEHPIPGFVIPTCVLPSAVFSKDGGYTVYVKVDERFKLKVLSHKHCGWNSIIESSWFGVPIVTWPMYADEMRLDYGTDINKLVMPDEMEKAIGMVMNGESEVTERIC
ncbi:hypothetical protein V6N11_026340 [Hibiscus sabdariffa]|uniref:Uncharacterized protein n=1 Tax=Hibiscus sabdariffa TaxID=183260 RepID=A0ABR2SVQ6_9ROSI